MAGLAPLEDAIQFLPFWENGVRFFNLLGPNGETVEFSQRLWAAQRLAATGQFGDI